MASIPDLIDDIDDLIDGIEEILETPIVDPIPPAKKPSVKSKSESVQSDCDEIIAACGGLSPNIVYSPPTGVADCFSHMSAQRDALKNANTDTERRDAAQLQRNYAAAMESYAT